MPVLPPISRPAGLSNPHLPVLFKPPPAITARDPLTPSALDPTLVVIRQAATTPSPTFVVIPETYGALNSSLPPGEIAGIVIGATAGFIVLLFLIYAALGFNPLAFFIRGAVIREEIDIEERSYVSREKPRRVRTKRVFSVTKEGITKKTRRTSTASRRARSPIVVERVRRREASPLSTISSSARVPPPPRRGGPAPAAYADEDEVVVIEENTPPRRKGRGSKPQRRSYDDDDDRRARR